MDLLINENVKSAIPTFKLGLITYHDITVTDTPQLLKGRFHLLIEEWLLRTEQQAVSDIPGVKEWRGLFKKVGTDPSRYRPSHESLIRRLMKERSLPSFHTAADINNCFSVYYEIPMGIYDAETLESPLSLRIGEMGDAYVGINGREMSVENKLLSADATGPFGSPIVDSKRSMVTEKTQHAVQLLYLRPSTIHEDAQKILESVSKTFVQFNGGEAEVSIID